MNYDDYSDTCLCRKCFIKICKPTKNEIKHIILTEYKDKCEKCGRTDYIVDYIEEN